MISDTGFPQLPVGSSAIVALPQSCFSSLYYIILTIILLLLYVHPANPIALVIISA